MKPVPWPPIFFGTDVDLCVSLGLCAIRRSSAVIHVRRMNRAEETEHRRKRTGLIISLFLPTISRFVQICHLPPIHYTLRRATFASSIFTSLHLKSAICPLYIVPSAVPLLPPPSLPRFVQICHLPPIHYTLHRATFSSPLYLALVKSAICPLYIIPSPVPLFPPPSLPRFVPHLPSAPYTL